LRASTGTRAHLLDSQWLGFIAEAHFRMGEYDGALTALDGAAQTAVAAGDCHYQGDLHRLRGAVLAATGEAGEAASWLHQGLDTASSQQAKSLELRAATSLARLLAEQDERQKAHNLLARSMAGSPRASTPPT
jgi:ATP/maltotriose-dependent transcriptional regulator MalT